MANAIAITVDNFQEEIVNSGKPAILDFWANWCPHCKRIAPAYEKFAEEYGDKLVVGKVDTDSDPAIAQKYMIEYLPTFLLLDAQGNVVDKVIAPPNKAAIEEFVTTNLAL